MSNVRVLFENVYLIEGAVGERPLRLPLLVGEEKSLLMDTGTATDAEGLILPALEEAGLEPAELSFILTTHCDFDHQGGNCEMKRAAPQALLACGDADRAQVECPKVLFDERYNGYCDEHGYCVDGEAREALMDDLGEPQPVDVTFRGGERLRLAEDWAVEIVHLPGHSRGHLGVLDRQNCALYGSDAIHGTVYLDFEGEAALCPTYLYVRPYLQTIRRVEHLNIDTYVGCHWAVKRGQEIAAFCAESRHFVEEAERLILRALGKSDADGLTLEALCHTVGPQLGDWPEAVHDELRFAFAGHLRVLEADDRIQRVDGAVPARFRVP
jgi:glyoxylase-like metal-dependent hydrolase (beta-lactamase superfamily II)